MIERKERESTEINASSMADIAFLLLIFFLVTTTVATDKGITMALPPWIEDAEPPDVKDKNVLKVVINSADRLQIEEKETQPEKVREITRKFLTNNGKDPKSSVSPQKAVVSIKTDRGSTYAVYADVLDEIKMAYYELRAESVGISFKKYMDIINTKKIDRTQEDQDLYNKAKKNFPLQISEAEPTGN